MKNLPTKTDFSTSLEMTLLYYNDRIFILLICDYKITSALYKTMLNLYISKLKLIKMYLKLKKRL